MDFTSLVSLSYTGIRIAYLTLNITMRKINYCIAILQFFFCLATAQNKAPFKVNVIPPSPEAAQLAKYADVPVSLYTGTPKISIPIYTITERGLALPISLDHHASAHKVETVAPRTGLGWSLNAGGVITRSVRGLPDEYHNGLLQGFLERARILRRIDDPCKEDENLCADAYSRITDSEEKYNAYRELANGCWDAEPDLFYFNVSGYTGSFQFDWYGNLNIVSEHPIKIEPFPSEFIIGWFLTLPDGSIYTFGAIETQKNQSPVGNVISDFCGKTINDLNVPQSWFLTEMYNPNTEGRIIFEYEDYRQTTQMLASGSKTHNVIISQFSVQETGTQGDQKFTMVISGKYLKRITTSSGQTTVDLFQDTDFIRQDAGIDNSPSNPLHPLGGIKITNPQKVVEEWKMTYDNSTNRLTLKELQKKSPQNPIPPYVFEYAGTLPNITSYQRDFWGYYNNNSPQTLVPKTTYGINDQVLEGANRSSAPNKITQGMIKKITYPTGGTDEFTFESHDYSYRQGTEILGSEADEAPFHEVRAAAPGDTPRQGLNQQTVDFTLTSSSTTISIFVSVSYIDGIFGGDRQNPTFRIVDQQGNVACSNGCLIVNPGGVGASSYSGTVSLDAGDYTLIASTNILLYNPDDPVERIGIVLSWRGEPEPGTPFTKIIKGAGSRIAKIERTYGFGNPNKSTTYDYHFEEDNVIKSSGSLLEAKPEYQMEITYCDGAGCDPLHKLHRFSQNRTALGTTQGSHVGYRQVTVSQGENNENGKSIHYFSSPYTVHDRVYGFPFPPATSYDYKRGLLKKREDYDNQGNLVHKIVNEYQYKEKGIRGIKYGWINPSTGSHEGPKRPDRIQDTRYINVLGYTQLLSTEEINYFGNNFERPLVQRKVFDYSNTHKQLTQETTIDSEGKKIITQYKYPLDYDWNSNNVLANMVQRNLINPVIEKVTMTQENGGNALLSAQKTEHKFFEGNIYPHQIYTAKIAVPISTNLPFNTAQNLYEPRYIFSKYSKFGNLLEQSQLYGNQTSYIWNEQGTFPILKAIGARKHQVFYTSFENTGTTGNAKTGDKYFNAASYTIPEDKRPTGNHLVMTYWYYKNGTWNFQDEIPYQSTISHPGASRLDEIRVSPKGTLMSSYTYKPLIGVTSITDPNNTTQYFDYDDQKRLMTVKDYNKHILEHYEYHFKQN